MIRLKTGSLAAHGVVWLALSYQVPISPSRARVYVWRKLRELGAVLLRQGVAILPHSAQNIQGFMRLAQKIRQMDGQAQILELRFLEQAEESVIKAKFQKQIEKEYQELIADCTAVLRKIKGSPQEKETYVRLLKRYKKAYSRDFFRYGSACAEIEAGLRELLDTVHSVLP